ncbi:hypothetical protein VYU27_002638 [Nannochloropsis oceanica]
MSLPAWPSRKRGATITSHASAAAAVVAQSPPFPSSSSTSRRKRPLSRSDQNHERQDSCANDNEAPELTDVAAALSLLIQRYYLQPHTQGQSRGTTRHARTITRHPSSSLTACCPVVLHHQLYTILDDHTAVDVELEDLRRRNYVRLFRLLTLRRDVGVILTATYVARVQTALDRQVEAGQEQELQEQEQRKGVSKMEEDARRTEDWKRELQPTTATSKTSAQDMAFVFSFFLKAVEAFTSLSVTRRQLETLLTNHLDTLSLPSKLSLTSFSTSCNIGRPKYPAIDLIIRVLLHNGFLARRVDAAHEEEAYWFSTPELGRVTVSLPHGRKAILTALHRSRYKELSERNLGALDLKDTILSLPFHIADLVGSKEVLTESTASGVFLKLPPAAATGERSSRNRTRRT